MNSHLNWGAPLRYLPGDGRPLQPLAKGPLPHSPRPGCDLGARQSAGDSGEDIADLRAEYRQYRDDDNGHQYEYERVLNQALALLLWQIQHLYHLLSMRLSATTASLKEAPKATLLP